jgi:hypothetical protein
MQAMIIDFNLYSDIERLKARYEEQLTYCNFMINKLRENSYKSDNSSEIMDYSNQANHLVDSLKKLEEIG